MNLNNIKDVRKTIFILVSISLILIGILAFSIYGQALTGQVVEESHTYTKAICDDENFCEDYEIICNEEDVVSINPTGYVIQNNEGWQDPRPEDERNMDGLCNVTD